jgi:hypothetical protein
VDESRLITPLDNCLRRRRTWAFETVVLVSSGKM